MSLRPMQSSKIMSKLGWGNSWDWISQQCKCMARGWAGSSYYPVQEMQQLLVSLCSLPAAHSSAHTSCPLQPGVLDVLALQTWVYTFQLSSYQNKHENTWGSFLKQHAGASTSTAVHTSLPLCEGKVTQEKCRHTHTCIAFLRAVDIPGYSQGKNRQSLTGAKFTELNSSFTSVKSTFWPAKNQFLLLYL